MDVIVLLDESGMETSPGLLGWDELQKLAEASRSSSVIMLSMEARTTGPDDKQIPSSMMKISVRLRMLMTNEELLGASESIPIKMIVCDLRLSASSSDLGHLLERPLCISPFLNEAGGGRVQQSFLPLQTTMMRECWSLIAEGICVSSDTRILDGC